jgi:hypothetical protein
MPLIVEKRQEIPMKEVSCLCLYPEGFFEGLKRRGEIGN